MRNGGTQQYTGGLVNMDKGMISRDIFVSDDIYHDELERIFPRS